MISVNATSQTALATLSLLKSQPTSSSALGALEKTNAVGLDPIGSGKLSPRVSDAIMKIREILEEQQTPNINFVAQVQPTDDPSGYQRGPLTSLADLPSYHAEKLRVLGADAAVKRTAPAISDAAFRALVLQHGMEHWPQLDGFDKALASGILKIQRASDVPELGLGSSLYDLYKNGSHIGGAYFGNGSFNQALFLKIQDQGVRQATGSINGHEYYVTWPDNNLKGDLNG